MFESIKEHKFNSTWITTKEFSTAKYINVIHRENDKNYKVEDSITSNYHVVFYGKINCVVGNKYQIDISADDYYKLYVNGRYVSQGVKQAPIEIYNYNSVDISSYVVSGENFICVRAYYHGKISRAFQSGDNCFGIIADIFENGNYVYGTDKSWKYCQLQGITGHSLGYDTAFTENVDFTKLQSNFKFGCNDSDLQNAFADTSEKRKFVYEPTQVVDCYKVIPEVIEYKKNSVFIDMGKEYVGSLYLKVKGERNAKITVRYAESLNDNKQLNYDMPTNMLYQETYVLSGQIDEIEPFDYKGFRYAEIINTNNLQVLEVYFLARNKKFINQTKYIGNDEKMQRIYDLCVHTLKVSCQEYLVDCPTREKGGYLGDLTVSGLAYTYLTKDAEFYKRLLQDFANSRFIDDGLMAVYPGSHMQEIADYSLQYPLQLYNYYKYSNDKQTVKQLLSVCKSIIESFKKFARQDGLLEGVNNKWNLVDWPENLRDGYDFELTNPPKNSGCHNVINAFYVGAIKIINKLSLIVGLNADLENEKNLINCFNNEFYDKEKGLYKDTKNSKHCSLHSNTLPLFFKFEHSESTENIVNMIERKGLVCGTYFSYFVLKALTNANKKQIALNLMLNEGENGWINMLNEGATTTFEVWGKKQKWNTSLCHAWSTAPIIILYEDFNQIVY